MIEITELGDSEEHVKLSHQEQEFILQWGEFACRWGLTRATGQVHALLLLSPIPLDAAAIAAALGLARSNVSVSIKELRSWEIIESVMKLGDRKEFFQVIPDSWQMLERIARKRLQQEVLPVIALLQGVHSDTLAAPNVERRLAEIESIMQGGVTFFERASKLPAGLVRRLLKLESRIERALRNEK